MMVEEIIALNANRQQAKMQHIENKAFIRVPAALR